VSGLAAPAWLKIPSLAWIKIFPIPMPETIKIFCSILLKKLKVKEFLISFMLKKIFPLRYNKYPEAFIQYHFVSGITFDQCARPFRFEA
jgi:hypothetical protein